MSPHPSNNANGMWFVYDGACPLCQTAATYFKIKEIYGALHLLDARSDPAHPILQQINARHIDLDDGFVIIQNDNFYHSKDALRFMSDSGAPNSWFNRIVRLFRSKIAATIFYPLMKMVRNLLLRLRGIHQINNLNEEHTYD